MLHSFVGVSKTARETLQRAQLSEPTVILTCAWETEQWGQWELHLCRVWASSSMQHKPFFSPVDTEECWTSLLEVLEHFPRSMWTLSGFPVFNCSIYSFLQLTCVNVRNAQTCNNFYEYIWTKPKTIAGKQISTDWQNAPENGSFTTYLIH